jgi:hypothetical protein
MREEYLARAVDIGHAIADTRVEADTGVYWGDAGPDLYDGNAGIGLFLAHLYEASRESCFRHLAEQAMRWALVREASAPRGQGFFSGRSGIAYAALRVGSLIADASLERDGSALLDTVEMTSQDGPDVISGTGGALLALAASVHRAPLADSMRARLVRGAELLRDAAARDHIGWGWKIGPFPAPLTGYAHGAAGIGHALLEVWRLTGLPWTRYLAEQAFGFEQHFARCRNGAMDWPDLRRGSDVLMMRGMHTDMKVWCYGSVGIGMSRLRAFDLLGDEQYREQALAAWRSASAVPARALDLCHGTGGTVDFDLQLYQSLGDSRFLDHAFAMVERCMDRRPERTGDPSLMLGLAGAGFALLRVASLGALPSVLIVSAPAEPPARTRRAREDDEVTTVLRWDHIGHHFPITVRLVPRPDPLPPIDTCDAGTDLRWFQSAVEGADSPPDCVRYESLLLQQRVLAAATERRFVVPEDPPWVSFDWTTQTFALAPDIRIGTFERAWGLVARGADLPEPSPCAYVFFSYYETAGVLRASVLITEMIRQLEAPSPGREWATRVRRALSVSDDQSARFERLFAQQLEALYGASIIVHASVG